MKETSSVCGCRWRTLWTPDVTFIIYDILYRNFKTQLFEILLFCSVNTGCFVEYNACYVLHFVTAIILRHTKNIYEMCNCKPHRLKANFLISFFNVIFIQIDQQLKKLLQKYKGVPILWITVYISATAELLVTCWCFDVFRQLCFSWQSNCIHEH